MTRAQSLRSAPGVPYEAQRLIPRYLYRLIDQRSSTGEAHTKCEQDQSAVNDAQDVGQHQGRLGKKGQDQQPEPRRRLRDESRINVDRKCDSQYEETIEARFYILIEQQTRSAPKRKHTKCRGPHTIKRRNVLHVTSKAAHMVRQEYKESVRTPVPKAFAQSHAVV
jgi:hypothetical protein